MTLVDRLKQYMDHINLPISQFADQANIARPTLSQILGGRNKKISNELLEKLHAAYPRMNVSWLLFGDGDMEVPGSDDAEDSLSDDNASQHNQTQNAQMDNPKDNAASGASSQKNTSKQSIQATKEASKDTVRDFIPDSETDMGATESMRIKTPSSKKIARIIVFYTDDSFQEYKPDRD